MDGLNALGTKRTELRRRLETARSDEEGLAIVDQLNPVEEMIRDAVPLTLTGLRVQAELLFDQMEPGQPVDHACLELVLSIIEGLERMEGVTALGPRMRARGL